MKTFSCLSILGVGLLSVYLLASPAAPQAPSTAVALTSETAVAADAFVNSVGVNVHMHFADTSYGNFAGVEKGLKDLGVRHLRDGLVDTEWKPYYERLNELGRMGVKSLLITSVKQKVEMVAGFPPRVADSIEAFEAPNEYDISGDKDWAATLTPFSRALFEAVRANPGDKKYPVVGPSVTQAGSFDKVSGTAQFFDISNLHNYFGGRNPGTRGWGANGYGSYEWNLELARKAWKGKEIWTTETGYRTDTSVHDSAPEVVVGAYVPRLLLLQWMHGIRRTYLYELVDLGKPGNDSSMGLLRADFTAKPAYAALRNILRLLNDGSADSHGSGGEFTAGKLEYSLSGELNDVNHLLLEKRDGTFYLAVWVERPGWDVDKKERLAVAEQRVTLTTKNKFKTKLYQLGEDGEMRSSELGAGTSQAVKVGERVTILEIAR
jgi:hypothetical protein